MGVPRQGDERSGVRRSRDLVHQLRLVHQPELGKVGIESLRRGRHVGMAESKVIEPRDLKWRAANRHRDRAVDEQIALSELMEPRSPPRADTRRVIVVTQNGDGWQPGRAVQQPARERAGPCGVIPLIAGEHQKVGTLVLEHLDRVTCGRVRLIGVQVEIRYLGDRGSLERGR